MTDPDSNPVADLFDAALQLPPTERARFLDESCRGRPAVRDEVLSLLDHHDRETSFLADHPMPSRFVPGALAEVMAKPLDPGTPVGRYTILGVLGEGGMGTVYRAQQENPRREVALKVVRPGAATPELLRRFEYEAHVLGRLQHPGIAQIFEAGAGTMTDGSVRPFFAMELVKGRPLNAFAKARSLDTRARLDLFTSVCDAIHHAHQRGLIHRDLKPGNILVGDDAQPKILDFGIARAAEPTDGRTLHTHVGQVVGTIPYMSPEQAALNPGDLDTRSDVYALGVILHELLTGRLPYDLDKKPVPEALEIIRSHDPSRLSTISRDYRGDVETIVGKALEKDRTRRYQSAAELADDIRRSLRDEPIVARPPSAMYQFTKYAKRNKAVVAGVLAVLGALIVGVVMTYRESQRTRQALIVANNINAYFQNMLLTINQVNAQDGPVTVKQLLDRGSAELNHLFIDQPPVAAGIRRTLSSAYMELGDYTNAEIQSREAVRLTEIAFGNTDPMWFQSARVLCIALVEQRKYAEAQPLALRAYENAKRVLGPEAPLTDTFLTELAIIAEQLGDRDQAERYYRESLAVTIRREGETSHASVNGVSNLAMFLMDSGKRDQAAALLEPVLPRARETFGDRHPATLNLVANLGTAYERCGRLAEAEPLMREAVKTAELTRGPDDADTLLFVGNLGALLRRMKDLDGADAVLAPLLPRCETLLGKTAITTMSALEALVALRRDQTRFDEAEPLALEYYRRAVEIFGEPSPGSTDAAKVPLELYQAWNKPEQAAIWNAKTGAPVD